MAYAAVAAWLGTKKGGILGSPARPPRVKYCGDPNIGGGGKPMKFDIVAPAGPSVVMYAMGCFRRAALDITQSDRGSVCWLDSA